MRNTTKYSLPVPSAGTDVDDVPTHLGGLGDAVDLALGSRGGSYASRPAASIEGQMYFVTGSGTNAGLLYRDNGSSWDQVNYPGGPTGSVSTMGFSDSPAAGTPSSGYAPIDHRHGSQSNPVVAHLAASNPHPQYLLAASGSWTNFTGFGTSFVAAAGVNPLTLRANGTVYWAGSIAKSDGSSFGGTVGTILVIASSGGINASLRPPYTIYSEIGPGAAATLKLGYAGDMVLTFRTSTTFLNFDLSSLSGRYPAP